MDQTTFNWWSVIAQYASIAVSIGVGAVVWWYTRVTKGIRVQGQRQLELLQAQLQQGERQLEILQTQLQLGLAPYLIARVTAYRRGGQIVPNTKIADARGSQTCRIWNPTDRPAHQVSALVYTGGGNYFWSGEDCDVLVDYDGDGAGHELTARQLQSQDDVIHAIQREYRQDGDRYIDLVRDTAHGFLAIFFRDFNGNLYVAVRQVDFDGHGEEAVMHHTNRILRPFGENAVQTRPH